jgi:NADH-quinone oxidoreductase subunit G
VSAELVTLTVDGRQVTVPKGTLVIRAAEQVGAEVPRFCDHPYLAPAGACRQCYVEIEGQPKLATSCTVAVAPGMVVRTQNTSETARQAQVANLEFLLLNHPLDCPICDRGGECPLQDQALAYGPGESRFREAKRVFPKPVPMSSLVNLDRERCVLCARCTRFCDEISGDRFLELFARGAGERVSIAAGEDLRSPFSGNTVQICPVGALTATPYRFVARPFDLTSGDSICGHCSAGCNVRVDVRRGEVVRVLARDNAEVNDAWICDKGRFAFGAADAPTRITTPLLRERGLEPASFGEVLLWIADRARGRRVAFLAGGRLLDEDAYALAKLARTVVGTNDLDHRRGRGGGLAEVVAARTPLAVTAHDVERARVIVVAGLDAEQEVPILHLRLRKAAARGAKIVVLASRRTRLHDVAEHVLLAPGALAAALRRAAASAPGGLAASGDPMVDFAFGAIADAGPDGLVLAGEQLGPAAGDAWAIAAAAGARFAYATRRAGDRGALRAGVHPTLLPGGRRLDDREERAEVEAAWGPILAAEPGRDALGILHACASHEIDVLFLVGVDPLRDLPDATLARRALDNVETVVVQGLELGSLEPFASAFLPAAAPVERDGHLTDWEGRRQRLRPVRPNNGLARPDWEILASLALAMGGDLGFETLDELEAEMAPLLASRSLEGLAPATSPDEGAPAPEGSLELFTYPSLIDEGRLSEGADELKAALEEPAAAWIHPDTASDGLAGAARARLRTAAGEAVLDLRVTPDVARGAVFVPFNDPGLAANTLLSGAFTAAVAVEADDDGPQGVALEAAATGGEA